MTATVANSGFNLNNTGTIALGDLDQWTFIANAGEHITSPSMGRIFNATKQLATRPPKLCPSKIKGTVGSWVLPFAKVLCAKRR